MNSLQFNEESLLTNNIFKYEQRLHSHTNKYVENGAVLTTYFNMNEDATTVDRGLKDIEQIFGKQSPLRYNQIDNFPLYGFNQANPNNTDENQVEDITVEGDCIILPSTIVPHQHDFFIVNHLKMRAFFQVVEVTYDSMKVEGYYKIRYRLHSTSAETQENLTKQTIGHYKCDLFAVGTQKNPIIKMEDFVRKAQIEDMVNDMITSYRSLYYNEKHNCFLYRDQKSGLRWFDLCGNDFIAKNSLMNFENGTNVITLHHKLNEPNSQVYYNRSIYSWIERDAPIRFLNKFNLRFLDGIDYRDSSFHMWSEDDIAVAVPAPQDCHAEMCHPFFDTERIELFLNKDLVSENDYEMLIKKYINGQISSIQDISLYTSDALMSSIKNEDIFLYTPIIIYIIRKILEMN